MSTTGIAEKWVDAAAGLTRPTRTVWCDGSKAEYDAMIEAMLRDGTLSPLNDPFTVWSRAVFAFSSSALVGIRVVEATTASARA